MLTHDAKHLEYAGLLREAKNLGDFKHDKTIKLALLGDVATQHLAMMIRALLAKHKIRAEIYEGDYGAAELEVLNTGSEFFKFGPDIIVILQSTHANRDRYYASPRSETFAEESVLRVEAVWEAIHQNSKALIIQGNVALPYERLFGQYDQHVPGSLSSCMMDFNQRLSSAARVAKNVRILDSEYLASYVGRKEWFDEKMWAVAKTLCAPKYLPLVAQSIVDITLSQEGRGVKCLILDLDNTLWGGVIGDDGVEGIVLGHGHPEGEAFQMFQRFLRALKNRGIVLTVCSKNDQETALKPFREHPEMVLKEEDIAVFVANWENKVDNIRYIREVLNLGFDSMLFLDDSSFERNLVRERLPGVIVPELPEDPVDFIKFLSELNLFETASFSEEDTHRADMYREEAARTSLQQEFSSIDEYLVSLKMHARAARFDEFHLPRITQLMLRSNQFNLTTRRYSQEACAEFMRDQMYHPFYATLSDKFGDYGLIGLAILEHKGERAVIDEWLMSCRVLSRGVEELMLNHAVATARAWGCAELIGEYIPTPKNAMVKEFYPKFGFELVSDTAGTTIWKLPLRDYQPAGVFIKIV